VDSKEVDAVTDGFKHQTPPKSKSLLPSLLKQWRQPERGASATPRQTRARSLRLRWATIPYCIRTLSLKPCRFNWLLPASFKTRRQGPREPETGDCDLWLEASYACRWPNRRVRSKHNLPSPSPARARAPGWTGNPRINCRPSHTPHPSPENGKTGREWGVLASPTYPDDFLLERPTTRTSMDGDQPITDLS
jgi:hypothetical protein